MDSYEVEIKSLLGQKENAEKLLKKLEADPSFISKGGQKQLNHYFIGGNLEGLCENVQSLIEPSQLSHFKQICQKATDFSVRSRWSDGKVILVIKASIDDTTSSNGTARLEFESRVSTSMEQLDQIILKSGFQYQAKWSRERQEFKYKDMNISIDKNAGYGYLAEFEKVLPDISKVDQAKQDIRDFMADFGIEELDQDRLERMFAFYNANWQDYYGTDKVFVVD
jgi:predicted adenylyl cyclase CyaB